MKDTSGEQTGSSTGQEYVSERGPFELWETPKMTPAYVHEEIQDVDPAEIGRTFEFSELADKYGFDAAQNKIAELVKASASGTSTTMLFSQSTPGGMSLVHNWFGPNFPLFRHSHAAYGDCLYYVIAGELRMGERRLGPGAGMFVPNYHAYRFTAGPAGLELLEFRAGGGVEGGPGLKMEERTLDAIQKLIDEHNVQRPLWRQPENIGDTAFVQLELDLGSIA